MKRVSFTATALIALGGMSSALAEVSVSGYTRFTYDDNATTSVMNPDYNVWIKADDATDTGLEYGGAIRVTPDDGLEPGSRHYIWLKNEMGTVTMGQHHGPAYTMSLGADWRGTVSAAGDSSYNVFQGHSTPRVIYKSPNISGFQFGTSVSQGTDKLGTEAQTGINYSIPFNDAVITLGHSISSVDGIDDIAPAMKSNETGVEIKRGGLTASFLTFDRNKSGTTKTEPTMDLRETYCYSDLKPIKINEETGEPMGWENVGQICHIISYYPGEHTNFRVPLWVETVHDESVSGNEIELAYAVNNALTLNVVKFNTDTTNADNNTTAYNRTSIGAKYTIAPGLVASLSQSAIDNAGTDEDAMRFRLNYSF